MARTTHSPSALEAILIAEGRIALDENGRWIKPPAKTETPTLVPAGPVLPMEDAAQ
ncbi:MAG TPA: hypothetical protein VHO25_10505 [Polyangiaceae bacterium]|nr:hypothetical protein [Polyangiaceae bacterium]